MNLDIALLLLRQRIRHARNAHPEGASLAALVEEVDEALAEPAGSDRERDELLDVAAVAIRLWLGEVYRRG